MWILQGCDPVNGGGLYHVWRLRLNFGNKSWFRTLKARLAFLKNVLSFSNLIYDKIVIKIRIKRQRLTRLFLQFFS